MCCSQVAMVATVSFVSSLPVAPAFQVMMREFYQIMTDKLVDAGGPFVSPEQLAEDTIAHIQDVLPPNRRTLLAYGSDGLLLGCGVIKKIRPDAAELKRVYVRPAARGTGLGRRILEMQIAEVRRMGCRSLYADTVKANTSMLIMFEKLGFSTIPRYPENANGAKLEPFMVYQKYVFPDSA